MPGELRLQGCRSRYGLPHFHGHNALLDAIGLPLESACHRFYEQQRPIHTASSEQVRQPVYSSAVGYWKNYEPSLSVLKAHLFP